MKWFGESWGAPACDPAEHVDTPEVECGYWNCKRPIVAGDRGFLVPHLDAGGSRVAAWHLDCFLKSVGLNPMDAATLKPFKAVTRGN